MVCNIGKDNLIALGDDDLGMCLCLSASVAHVALCCMAGSALGRVESKNFTHPGMHANFFLHGIAGFLNYQSGTGKNDFTPIYKISLNATRYLAIPCLMADLYNSDKGVSTTHLISGVLPFTMAMAGQESTQLGNLCIAANLVSLAYYSLQNEKQWGLYCAGAALLAYFAAPASSVKVLYPLTLALMEFCACILQSSAPADNDGNQRRR